MELPKQPWPIMAETYCDVAHSPTVGNTHLLGADVDNQLAYFFYLAAQGILS